MYLKILPVAFLFIFHVQSAQAAPVCPVATLYTTSNCALCAQVATEAKDSMDTLVRANRLEVVEIDAPREDSVGGDLPDLQVFDATTKKMIELFQVDPPTNATGGLIVQNSKNISTKLAQLAQQEECNPPVAATVPSVGNQLSARGISSPSINRVSDAISWYFNRVGSGMKYIFEFMVQLS